MVDDKAHFKHQCLQRSFNLVGLATLTAKAQLPPAKAEDLANELLSMGALDVAELSAADWQSLRAWQTLLPFEQRRLLKAL